ncbi:unnamed protein product [Phytophthora fragariaefolia]|uniref:Unnamed protein product n=1 Tax=Phytophthora fragariaefolia TaxID=1490495 RepID=A0A9W7DAI6_9STRA|nr:unnamed protein product [Phytophthora fragariaefolia]
MAKVRERTSTLQNGHIPDVQSFFKANLRMDMSEKDIDARVLKYFVDLDQLVEDDGFETLLGVGSVSDTGYRDRMKQRSLPPDANGRKPDKRQTATVNKKNPESKAKPRTSGEPAARQTEKKPGPREGCWICKGAHFAQQRPTATEEQKTEARRRLDEARARKVKAARVFHAPNYKTASTDSRRIHNYGASYRPIRSSSHFGLHPSDGAPTVDSTDLPPPTLTPDHWDPSPPAFRLVPIFCTYIACILRSPLTNHIGES